MNHELAKTITTALVQFIDRERPEGSLCCSSAECEKMEKAVEGVVCYGIKGRFSCRGKVASRTLKKIRL